MGGKDKAAKGEEAPGSADTELNTTLLELDAACQYSIKPSVLVDINAVSQRACKQGAARVRGGGASRPARPHLGKGLAVRHVLLQHQRHPQRPVKDAHTLVAAAAAADATASGAVTAAGLEGGHAGGQLCPAADHLGDGRWGNAGWSGVEVV
jgi:hypothetical protein